MKVALLSLAALIALALMGAGGFLIGYQQYERSLLASTRSPVRLEQEIIELEMENQSLRQQVGDLQDQVKASNKSQADSSKAVAALEASIEELKRELAQEREKSR